MPKHHAAYVRVSTDEQNIDMQRAEIVAFCDRNEIIIPSDGWYIDEGKGGDTLNRPALRSLRDDVKARKVDLLVLYHLDRLSRDIIDGLTLLREFLFRGVTIRLTCGDFDLRAESGELIAGLLFQFADMERKRIRDRCKHGIRRAEERLEKVRELSDRGWSAKSIAKQMDLKLERVEKMMATPRSHKIWWGGGRHGARVAKHADIPSMVRNGLSGSQIARALGISTATVERRIKLLGGRAEMMAGP